MTIYAIDSWVSPNYFQIQFDSYSWTGPSYSVYSFYKSYCGSSLYNDMVNIRVFGTVAHSAGSLRIRVVDQLSQATSTASVAVREVNLLLMNNPTSPPGNTACVVSDITPSASACTCKEGKYWTGSACASCNSLCASCFGAGANQCYQCAPGASNINNYCTACSTGCSVCHGTTETDCDACLNGYFLYNGNSCVYPCNYPLVNSTDTTGVISYCAMPTGCASTDFLYWDQSCNASCIAPLQQNTLIKFVKTCTFPCADDEFLLWDGSCSATCKEPLLQGTYLSKFFCYYTCPLTQYLYWNGTCSTECLFPHQIQTSHGRQFCVYICDEADYLYWNGSCHSTCPFPLTTRIADGRQYCDYGCLPTEYLYWDGSCEITCGPYPLTIEIQGTLKPRQFCHYIGLTTDYLFWNASYLSSCPFPLTTVVYKSRNFCVYPCASGEILFWNATCLPVAECTNGLWTRAEPGALFCDYPCDPAQFLYWDYVCDTSCPAPLIQSVVGGTYPRYYCNFGRCNLGEYLYWNSSCLTYCGPDYTTTTVHSQSLCHFPCGFKEFLYYDGSCKVNCPLPYSPRYQAEMNYCDYPCLTTQYLYQNGSCLYSCDSPMYLSTGSYGERYCLPPCSDPLKYYDYTTKTCVSSCSSDAAIEDTSFLACLPVVYTPPQGFMDLLLTASASPGDPSFISFHKLSQYIRYVDIDVPTRLEVFVYSQGKTIISWDLGFGIPDSIEVTKRTLPPAFERHGMPSSFLVNMWSEIIFFGSIFVAACLLKILEKAAEIFEWTQLAPALGKLKTIFMFNFCFVLIGYYGDSIILYTCLDLISMNLESTTATVSLFVSIAFLLMLVLVLGLNVYVVYQYRKLRQYIIANPHAEEKYAEFHDKWQSCLVFYREFRDDSWPQQLFYMIYVLRTAIPSLFIVVTSRVPLAQTIFEVVVSVLILAFIIWKQPLKRTINHVQLLCYEICTFIIALCALLLTVIKPSGTMGNSHVRTFIGDLIIIGNVFLNVTAVVFLVLKVCLEVRDLYIHYKGQYSTEKAPWVRLLVILLQQPAFGFEEMLESNTIDTLPAVLAKERQSLTVEKAKAMEHRNSRRVFPAPKEILPEFDIVREEEDKETDLAPQNYAPSFEPLKIGSPLELSRRTSNRSADRFKMTRRGAQPSLQVHEEIILEDPEENYPRENEQEMAGASNFIHSPVELQFPGTVPISRNEYDLKRRSRAISHLNSGNETPTLAEVLKKYG